MILKGKSNKFNALFFLLFLLTYREKTSGLVAILLLQIVKHKDESTQVSMAEHKARVACMLNVIMELLYQPDLPNLVYLLNEKNKTFLWLSHC